MYQSSEADFKTHDPTFYILPPLVDPLSQAFSVISDVYAYRAPSIVSIYHFLRLVRALALARWNFAPSHPHRQNTDRSTDRPTNQATDRLRDGKTLARRAGGARVRFLMTGWCFKAGIELATGQSTKDASISMIHIINTAKRNRER
jgi:hypothetical protein